MKYVSLSRHYSRNKNNERLHFGQSQSSHKKKREIKGAVFFYVVRPTLVMYLLILKCRLFKKLKL